MKKFALWETLKTFFSNSSPDELVTISRIENRLRKYLDSLCRSDRRKLLRSAIRAKAVGLNDSPDLVRMKHIIDTRCKQACLDIHTATEQTEARLSQVKWLLSLSMEDRARLLYESTRHQMEKELQELRYQKCNMPEESNLISTIKQLDPYIPQVETDIKMHIDKHGGVPIRTVLESNAGRVLVGGIFLFSEHRLNASSLIVSLGGGDLLNKLLAIAPVIVLWIGAEITGEAISKRNWEGGVLGLLLSLGMLISLFYARVVNSEQEFSPWDILIFLLWLASTVLAYRYHKIADYFKLVKTKRKAIRQREKAQEKLDEIHRLKKEDEERRAGERSGVISKYQSAAICAANAYVQDANIEKLALEKVLEKRDEIISGINDYSATLYKSLAEDYKRGTTL